MISVIIPTYNRANLIDRAIESVLAQTYEKWELILVDDGSTDNTEESIQKYLEDPRIKYVKKTNSGGAHSRNVGVENATGNYVTFLDSDDEALPDWLLLFNKEIEKGEKVICCGSLNLYASGKITKPLPSVMGPLFGNRIGRFTNGGVFVIEKKIFEKIKGYDPLLTSGHHSELAMRLFPYLDSENIQIKNIAFHLIKVYLHKGEKIRGDDKAIYDGAVYLFKKHKNLFLQHKNTYANNLGVAATSGIRIGKIGEAQKLFYKAWKLDPGNYKRFSRYVISFIPGIRDYFFKRKS